MQPDFLNKRKMQEDSLKLIFVIRYDATGNLVKMTYPDDTVVTYKYDKAGNIIKGTRLEWKWNIRKKLQCQQPACYNG